jgi:uncharacterized membrane protein YraQ (UPF0718 family)/YHS domain-containing protein
MLALTFAGFFDDVGRSLREGFFMLWQTLWPLVLGFGLSGAVQAFVSREQMEHAMGDHRPASVARASGFGIISSSCSYAASAMAKSLFAKGADFVSAMVFMFASTNLVVELGVVLVILMGWQFAAAELAGGPIMILLLVAFGSVVLRPMLVETARSRISSGSVPGAESKAPSAGADSRTPSAGADGAASSGVDAAQQRILKTESKRSRCASLPAWADAASYAVADLTMLRREMLVGYGVAGFLATLVPTGTWNTLFVHGHGVWTELENALVGPVIAFLSFVCSIGNVPLAAALWKGGISFGGVVSFIFADLISAPLVLIYSRYYGSRLTVRMVALFWAVMSGAGLIVGAIFQGAGLVPHRRLSRIVTTSFRWDYTTFLNIVFLAVFACLYWLYRNRERLGGGAGYAVDPVCGMQVRKANAPAYRRHNGRDHWFCSDHCAQRFDSQPARYAADDAQTASLDSGTT